MTKLLTRRFLLAHVKCLELTVFLSQSPAAY